MSSPPSLNPSPELDVPAAGPNGPGGVFWRTFFLIAILIGVSLGAWYQSFRILERTPRAQQAAQLVVSIVNLTRSALIHSDPEKRRALLIDLAQNEGIRIYTLEREDQISPLPDEPFLRIIDQYVRSKLGSDTEISLEVNGQSGLWVSFFIDEDGYWVVFDPTRLESIPRVQWLGWGAVALALSLLGAVIISRLINLPLKRLASAAVSIGRGKRPQPLPEKGPREIRQANKSFNAMVKDLERIEADRALLLAGISHDLRTPLTRLRLEIEMNPLEESTREAMSTDIEQMDGIIGQFLDYARPLEASDGFGEVSLGELVEEVVSGIAPGSDLAITVHSEQTRPVYGQRLELKRVLLNLLENARRYGRRPGEGAARVEITVHDEAGPVLEVADHGPGIPEAERDRLKRPFTRLDSARGQTTGSGLGLAIVERIALRHHARFDLLSRPGFGLVARLAFPVKPLL
ncbi:MAG: ATP-binding protein [Burkholderiaceae bacterium]|jgi:two-component system osmolarity sensor histidine kinase EnvZ